MSKVDAVVVGSGPNGLAAAIVIAQAGRSVHVIEGADDVGGGTRTRELTLPGFWHDECAAVHPMGVLSPFLKTLPLEQHGLTWGYPPASVAHPLDDGPTAMLYRDLTRTGEALGVDAARWASMVRPFLKHSDDLLWDLMGPLRLLPRRPIQMVRFGLTALRSAMGVAGRFKTPQARALFGGCAGHSILPLNTLSTAAVGLIFSVVGHVTEWPIAMGGSRSIGQAMAGYLKSLGGTIETGRMITTLAELPESRAVLFDTSPTPMAAICADELPARYRRRLAKYRYGPGVFKLDWALDGPIPWRDPQVADASTVHVGGTIEEIALSEADMWRGKSPDKPFLILCQQSHFDSSRAPAGKHTGYAYCHVPAGCTVDMTNAMEAQVERFAPGFRDRILARHTTSPAQLEALNPNYVGGAITGGVADLWQLFTRPVARLNPYTTPNKRLFICSASSPPGGGVHGMCGYWAAQAALKRALR